MDAAETENTAPWLANAGGAWVHDSVWAPGRISSAPAKITPAVVTVFEGSLCELAFVDTSTASTV